MTRWLLRPHPSCHQTDNGGVYWEIRLPDSYNISAKAHAPLHDDPEKQLWQATLTITVDFENSSWFRYAAQPMFAPSEDEFTVNAPDRIGLNTGSVPIEVLCRTEPLLVYSDDARVAVVRRQGKRFEIEPRRIGTFNLVASRAVGREEGPEVFYTKEITVTPYG